MPKKYVGTRPSPRTTRVVVVDDNGYEYELDPRLDLKNHSPDGFEWGYMGSGPAQLALAILADATGNDDFALRYYQDFKESMIGCIMSPEFELLHSDVMRWVEAKERT